MIKIKPLIATISLVLCSTASYASFNDQMDSAFGSMSNVTTAKSYNNARRGVLSGGQVFIRNNIKHVNLAHAEAPSFSAGCGGIDLYGGAFSFINADQMIETFQAIGSNALGYGVKLALASACPTCESVMTSLEKTAQAINKMNIDSCTAAQGIVDAGVDFSTGATAEAKNANKGVTTGIFDDFSNAWSDDTTTGKSASTTVKESDPLAFAKDVTGNVTWRAMIKSNLKNQYVNGNDDLLEIIQSMVGTVIITMPPTPTPATAASKAATPTLETRSGHIITLQQFIHGSDSGTPIKVYKCDTYDEDGCLDPSSTPTKEISNVVGFDERLKIALVGANGGGGLVNALQTDEEWSEDAKSYLSISTPMANLCLKHIRNASSLGMVGTAEYIGELCSQRMALEISYSMIMDYFDTVTLIILESKSSQKKEAIDSMQISKKAYKDEYQKLSAQAPFDVIEGTLNVISDSLKTKRKIGN